MKKEILLLVFFLLLFSSCDTFFHVNGIVVDSETLQPIANVKIQVKGVSTFYTDSLGQYKIDRSFLGTAIKVELLVEKSGYYPVYIDCNKKTFHRDQETIKMKRAIKPFVPMIPQGAVRVMYWFNLIVISLFNILTLVFVLFYRQLINKLYWVVAILLLNITIHFLYLDGSIVDFKIINGPVYLAHYWTYPYSVKIVLPMASLFFWIMFIYRRDSIIEN